ncbi:MAG: murein biosynthesis integral membrane protein MurJ, partial [Actinomycetes bacterium]
PPAAAPASDAMSLGRSSAVMAAGTFLSRITGFARVLAVTTVLGVNGLGDAYNYANSIPNIIFDLLIGGILSATLVPVFVEELNRRDRREARRAVSAIVTVIGAALIAVSVLLYLLAPYVIRFYLLANNQTTKADESAVATSLLHLFAPQVFFIGTIVVSTALLNARRRFAAAAFSPVINNLIAIAAIGVTSATASQLAIGPLRHQPRVILVLGLGTTLGYVVQLLVQIPAMRRAGLSLRPVWDIHHPAVRKVLGLSAWLVGVVVTNQISLNVILVLAGHKSGGATAYTTAYQFFQLPYALFTVSVASALTPDLAERWTRRDRRGFSRRMIYGLRVTLGVLVPAAAGYAVVAGPLIDLAVRHGHVSADGAHQISSSLALFAIGLPGFSAFVLLMRGFQAMQDTRAMFWMYALENALSLVAAVILYPLLGVKGLAIAWVGPYTIAAVAAAIRLGRRTGTLGGALTIRALWRIALAGAVMVVALVAVGRVLPHGGSDARLVLRLLGQLVVGTAAYLGAARLLGIEEIQPVLRLARRLRR